MKVSVSVVTQSAVYTYRGFPSSQILLGMNLLSVPCFFRFLIYILMFWSTCCPFLENTVLLLSQNEKFIKERVSLWKLWLFPLFFWSRASHISLDVKSLCHRELCTREVTRKLDPFNFVHWKLRLVFWIGLTGGFFKRLTKREMTEDKDNWTEDEYWFQRLNQRRFVDQGLCIWFILLMITLQTDTADLKFLLTFYSSCFQAFFLPLQFSSSLYMFMKNAIWWLPLSTQPCNFSIITSSLILGDISMIIAEIL